MAISAQVPGVTALRAEVDVPGGVEPRLAIEDHVTGAGARESGYSVQQRGLTGTGGPDQRQRLGLDGQGRAKLEGPAGEGDVDVEEAHERSSSLEMSRMAALTIISRTPMAIA